MAQANFGNSFFVAMEKAPQAIDDLHRMTDYIGDLRLITIVLAGTSYVVGIIFVLFKLYQCSTSRNSRVTRQPYTREIVDDPYSAAPQQVVVDRGHFDIGGNGKNNSRMPPVYTYGQNGRAYLQSTEIDPLANNTNLTLSRQHLQPKESVDNVGMMPNGAVGHHGHHHDVRERERGSIDGSA